MSLKLSQQESEVILKTIQSRFEKNRHRHEDLEWSKIEEKLLANPEKLWSLNEMEKTDGEPDVIGFNATTNEYLFCDCASESPKGRRSLCYDQEALNSRKEHKPSNSAIEVAKNMGIELLTEEEYFEFQKLGNFDTKTSSWLKTSEDVRKLGGAIFGDKRYERVFIYHNGAESYYAARGFRGILKV